MGACFYDNHIFVKKLEIGTIIAERTFCSRLLLCNAFGNCALEEGVLLA